MKLDELIAYIKFGDELIMKKKVISRFLDVS